MKFQIKSAALACALALAYAGGASAAMDRAVVKSEKDKIEAQYKAATDGCKDMKANAKDICMAEAKGMNKVAKADLEARDKGTPKAQYDLVKAKAEADYNLAKKKCDDLKGNPKAVCVKDAKAARTKTEADAKADMKTGKAINKAGDKVAEARKDAVEDKRDANYAAAKERCDALKGDAKDRCVTDAKARFKVK